MLCRRSLDKLCGPGRACVSSAGIPGPCGSAPRLDPAARPPAGGPWDTEVPLFTRSARPSERSRAPSLNARPDLPRAALPAFSFRGLGLARLLARDPLGANRSGLTRHSLIGSGQPGEEERGLGMGGACWWAGPRGGRGGA